MPTTDIQNNKFPKLFESLPLGQRLHEPSEYGTQRSPLWAMDLFVISLQIGRALPLPSLGTYLKYSVEKFCSCCLQEKLKVLLQSEKIRKNNDFLCLLCDHMYREALKIERELIYLLISNHWMSSAYVFTFCLHSSLLWDNVWHQVY